MHEEEPWGISPVPGKGRAIIRFGESTEAIKKETNGGLFSFLKTLFVYLRKRQHEQGEGQREKQTPAEHGTWSAGPGWGFGPRTLGS